MPNYSTKKYTYLYLEPGYYARFEPEGERILEVYNQIKDDWEVVKNPRLIRKLNEDSTLITYQEFLDQCS